MKNTLLAFFVLLISVMASGCTESTRDVFEQAARIRNGDMNDAEKGIGLSKLVAIGMNDDEVESILGKDHDVDGHGDFWFDFFYPAYGVTVSFDSAGKVVEVRNRSNTTQSPKDDPTTRSSRR